MERTSKKQTGWLLRVLVIGLLMWLGWAEGTPVAAADTVSIGTAAQLIDFANRVNTGETTLNGVLTADIELNKAINDDDTTNWSHWGEASPPEGLVPWTPIGIPTNRYTGSFDGAGHTVSGIYINAPEASYKGLFGTTKSPAVIKNLCVRESYIRGKFYTGAEADKEMVLAVGNTTAYPATYTPVDPISFDSKTIAIIPTISPRSLNAAGVVISQPPNVVYSGTALEPPITVADSGAVITADDYIVTYINNTSPGTATVTISGQGNYLGTVTRNFTITSGGGGGYTLPALSGISVTPQHISFDPSGQIAVDINGLPAAATVYYSLDGISYSTTPPPLPGPANTSSICGSAVTVIRITLPRPR